ncbi:UNVERIFIED_CONTAM: hypothetical protein Slati_0010900 [Sesamum latifolium]|uniref:Retrotransposon gag domain-containing protein n=1 Tax=Sesamum latifolium TaxID=2727402 RepID=A0AAW2Y637_9LAMI
MDANKIPALKAAAPSSNETIGVVMESMSKKAYLEVAFYETVEKDLFHLGGINEDDLKDDSSSFSPRSTSSIAPVMVTNTTTLEEQIANLTKAIEAIQRKREVINKELQVSLEGLIPVDQLKEFIMGTIQNKLGGSSKSSMTYTKSYTQRIDNLKIPVSYQPSKFQQFDGKGNPKQHVAHFIETCNNAGTYGDHLVKQFVQSLKENAFDWYKDLEASSIDSWEQLEQEFLNRFYSTRRTVGMIELTNSHQ